MSFSSEVKKELSNLNTYSKKELIEAEFIGYLISSNSKLVDGKFEFITENEFNIERLYKILFKLQIDYEPETKRKVYVARMKKVNFKPIQSIATEEEKKALIRGAFLGSGSVNNPRKKYHLEILLNYEDVAMYICNILKEVNIHARILENNNTVYIKEAEEISKFLAYIGAQKAVLDFEEVRVVKEISNSVNRQVNCETANLSRIVDAAVVQVDAINYLKETQKYKELPENLKEIAKLRLQYPEISLKELGTKLEKPIGKSGVNHRLKRIVEIAENIKNEEEK